MEGDEKSYSGRWVARLRGRVVAQGGTPEQARRAAQSRFKEKPEIAFMPTEVPLNFPPILETVRAALPDGLTLYLVGGAVRDLLLDRRTHDLDFALAGDGLRLGRQVADALQADFYPLDPERRTGRVLVTEADGSRMMMDFASFRGTSPSAGSRRPGVLPGGQSLESDLRGRDFTLNAIALDLSDNSIHDPLGGVQDLREKRLRLCSPSACTDDPVRILRGVRLAADFGFHIPLETRQAMKTAVPLLGNVSPERLRDELFRILEGSKPAACVRTLDALGALEAIFPELAGLKGMEQPQPHIYTGWEHTLAALDSLESILAALAPDYNPETASDLFNGLMVLQIGRYRQQFAAHLAASLNPNRSLRGLLFLAALYHDVAKPQTRKADDEGQYRFWGHDQQGAEMAASRARTMALSNDEVERLETIIRNHMRILFHTTRLVREGKGPSRRSIYRFFQDTGEAGVDVILLALADFRATYGHTLPQENWAACLDVCRTLLEAWWEKREERVAPAPLVNGDDLMRELGLQPGPQMGELLEAVREAQAVGKVSSREQALELAKKRIDETGKT